MMARVLIGLAIIAVVIGVLIFGQGTGSSLARKSTDTPAEQPGYSARNAQVVETGDDGRPQYTLDARVVRQRANDTRVQLDAPRMTFFATDGTKWHVVARSGLIQSDGSNVDLFGDVQLDGKVQERPVSLATSILSFDTQTEIARTQAPVTFDSNGGRLGGTGLLANLKDGTIRLESRVHGTFPPK
jgi:lipopolysaccharide export system protein LptC